MVLEDDLDQMKGLLRHECIKKKSSQGNEWRHKIVVGSLRTGGHPGESLKSDGEKALCEIIS